MGELRDRMVTDLRLRRMSAETERRYLSCVRQFAAYHRRSPTTLGEPAVRVFLTHLVEQRRVSPGTQAVYVAALRFLYGVTLRRPAVARGIPRPRIPHRQPEILSGPEITRLLRVVRSAKHRALLMCESRHLI